ncbi:30S ribosomal protein S17 [bacterium]|nr:30S ribosomal protein S17 [bacterium]
MKTYKKILTGTCVSNSMDRTITVQITNLEKHPLYDKRIKKRSKVMVDDPKNTVQVGEEVRVIESRPLSKRKRWILLENLGMPSERSESNDSRRNDVDRG